MKDIELQAERKAFEAWYEAYCMPSEADWFRRDVDDESEYHHAITADAWAAWQARAAIEADRAQRVPDENGDLLTIAYLHGFAKGKDAALAAATPAPAQQEPDWWRKRADEIELSVARSGSTEAMRCYTNMRALLQAVAKHQEPPQQERKPMTGQERREIIIKALGCGDAITLTERHHGIKE